MSEISRLEETMKTEVSKSRAEIREVAHKLDMLIEALAPQTSAAAMAAASPRGLDTAPGSPDRRGRAISQPAQ
jgi:hypothetical protein